MIYHLPSHPPLPWYFTATPPTSLISTIMSHRVSSSLPLQYFGSCWDQCKLLHRPQTRRNEHKFATVDALVIC